MNIFLFLGDKEKQWCQKRWYFFDFNQNAEKDKIKKNMTYQTW